MRPLSALELDGMRDTVKGLMTAVVQVWRRSHVVDPGGGLSDTYALHGTVYGFYYPSAAGNAETLLQQPDRIDTSEDYTFIFPTRTDIKHEDRLVVENLTLEVKSIGQTFNGLEIVMQVAANEIK